MLDFIVDCQTCTRCGQCVADCPAMIITMSDGYRCIAGESSMQRGAGTVVLMEER